MTQQTPREAADDFAMHQPTSVIVRDNNCGGFDVLAPYAQHDPARALDDAQRSYIDVGVRVASLDRGALLLVFVDGEVEYAIEFTPRTPDSVLVPALLAVLRDGVC
jgi:hypothetical protein